MEVIRSTYTMDISFVSRAEVWGTKRTPAHAETGKHPLWIYESAQLDMDMNI